MIRWPRALIGVGSGWAQFESAIWTIDCPSSIRVSTQCGGYQPVQSEGAAGR